MLQNLPNQSEHNTELAINSQIYQADNTIHTHELNRMSEHHTLSLDRRQDIVRFSVIF